MRCVAAVDPGIRGCGVAIFDYASGLVAVDYVRSPLKSGCDARAAAEVARAVIKRADYVDEFAVEWPRVYASQIRAGRSKADPNDLLALCGIGGALAALFKGTVTCYAPTEWKPPGMKKEVSHARIHSRLTASELNIVEQCSAPASLMHNVWDAIGIGLHHVGRMRQRRTP